jgi:hypothetical protein
MERERRSIEAGIETQVEAMEPPLVLPPTGFLSLLYI